MTTKLVLERTTGGFGFNIQRQIVVKVTPGGCADKAGLKKGLIITEVNGKDVSAFTHMQMIGLIKGAGNKLELCVHEGSGDNIPESMLTTQSSQPSSHPKPVSTLSPPTTTPPLSSTTTSISSSLPAPRKSSLPTPKAPTPKAPTPSQVTTKTTPPIAVTSAVVEEQAVKPSQSTAVTTPSPKSQQEATHSHASDVVKKVDTGSNSDPNEGIKDEKKKWERDPNADRKVFFKGKNGEVLMVHTPRCSGCNELIISSYVEIDKKKFHENCFVCSRCKSSLKDTGFSKEADDILCPTCWNKDNGIMCSGCGQFIVPDIDSLVPYMSIGDKHFHQDCLKCEECGIKFGQGVPGPFTVGGALLCKPHAQERKKIANGGNTKGTKTGGAILDQSKKGWK
eukprot:m.135506 g.135506  ORF g.135506 m.135506 type:complete len:394 (+) comp10056_c0_seq1:277-1458(+)